MASERYLWAEIGDGRVKIVDTEEGTSRAMAHCTDHGDAATIVAALNFKVAHRTEQRLRAAVDDLNKACAEYSVRAPVHDLSIYWSTDPDGGKGERVPFLQFGVRRDS